MKIKNMLMAATVTAAFCLSASAQITGDIYIHDPSTIVKCDGKYYTFGTGGGGIWSEDGYTWHSGAVRPGGGVAPDVIKIGDRYLISYSSGFPGTEGLTKGNIINMWNKTLDPQSKDFAFSKAMLVGWAGADDDCWAIDPAFLLGPDGRLWCTYGTYFGAIRIIELDPVTGDRKPGNKPVDVAIDCEATAMMYRNGWYYLLATHGTCCDGTNSTYNIVVGRSRNPQGPYLDNIGRDMLEGGGKMVLSAGNRVTGPGHFGQTIEAEGCEKMSCHFEADYDRSGRFVLGILPLLWKNDWPVAGDPFKEGTFEIESQRRGYALELTVDFIRSAGGMFGFGRQGGDNVVLENQKLEDVIGDWPEGNIEVRCSDYMFRPHQRWTVTAVPEYGGYLGQPYYKITIEGTDRALAAAEDDELTTVPAFTGAPEQLWRIDQLVDGTFRIMPKSAPGHEGEEYVLKTTGDSTVALGRYDFNDDNCKWDFRDR